MQAIRASTHTGRPLGSREFVVEAEHRLGRKLLRRLGGRPSRKAMAARYAAEYFLGGE